MRPSELEALRTERAELDVVIKYLERRERLKTGHTTNANTTTAQRITDGRAANAGRVVRATLKRATTTTKRKRLHWTQTQAGRAKMAAAQQKAWAKRRARARGEQ